jgi:hypothetical protein
VFKVASHAGVVRAHNQAFDAHSRPAGDAQQTTSPFSLMLDDAADGASAPPPKQTNDQSQPAKAGQPSTAEDATAPAAANSAPEQQSVIAAPARPAETAAETGKTTAMAAASVEDDQTATAKSGDESGAAPVVALANAGPVAPEQSLPATVIAPVTPFDASSPPEQTATSPDIAALAQSASSAQQLASAAGAAPAPKHSSSDTEDAPVPASQAPVTSAGTEALASAVPTPGPTGLDPKAGGMAKVAADKTGKPAAADANGSTSAATQPADAADANAISVAAAVAANDQHRDRHAESTTEEKKDNAAIASAARHIGTQNPEVASAPHVEAHAGDAVQTGKVSDGMQLVAMQHPADGLAATSASSAAQPASSAETAAAVPLAGVAVEIAARAQAGRNRFAIRLDPPELGRIDVRLDIDKNGHVTSRLTVDRVETLDALRRDAGDLQQALQQAGFKTADNGMQFTLRDQSFAGRDQSFPAMAAARVIVTAPEQAASDTVPTGYGRMLRPGGGIDIRV